MPSAEQIKGTDDSSGDSGNSSATPSPSLNCKPSISTVTKRAKPQPGSRHVKAAQAAQEAYVQATVRKRTCPQGLAIPRRTVIKQLAPMPTLVELDEPNSTPILTKCTKPIALAESPNPLTIIDQTKTDQSSFDYVDFNRMYDFLAREFERDWMTLDPEANRIPNPHKIKERCPFASVDFEGIFRFMNRQFCIEWCSAELELQAIKQERRNN